MSEMQMQASRSATIAAFGYDESTQVLQVRFRTTGQRYEYRDVPASLVEELRASESQGAFVAAQIRPHYQFRSLEWQPAPKAASKAAAKPAPKAASNSAQKAPRSAAASKMAERSNAKAATSKAASRAASTKRPVAARAERTQSTKV